MMAESYKNNIVLSKAETSRARKSARLASRTDGANTNNIQLVPRRQGPPARETKEGSTLNPAKTNHEQIDCNNTNVHTQGRLQNYNAYGVTPNYNCCQSPQFCVHSCQTNHVYPNVLQQLSAGFQMYPQAFMPQFSAFSMYHQHQLFSNPVFIHPLSCSQNASNHSNSNFPRRSLQYTENTNAVERDRQFVEALRTWQLTNIGQKMQLLDAPPKGIAFTLMSYNVLAQQLLEAHPYLYRNHNARALAWEQRWENLLREIRKHDADILCLQEVQQSHLEKYYSIFKSLGYSSIYKQRTGIRTDGCAIYYKTNVLKLVENTTVEFKQSNVSVLDRDNVAIVAKFAPKQKPGSEFVVATTHLLYNPRREDVRVAQTQVLLTEVDRISFKKSRGGSHTHLPIIITGDFNSEPHSAVYQLLVRGELPYEKLSPRKLDRTLSPSALTTGKKLVPSFLRITDNCQHADIAKYRKMDRSITREEELAMIQLQHSERPKGTTDTEQVDKNLFSTGTLSHDLALQSVFKHQTDIGVEATTFQDQWVTVDYIFYSGLRRHDKSIKDGNLRLLARYAPPASNNLQGANIPNLALGSDHFSLLAKFQLEC